jgi:hypothetical protein
VGDIDLLSSTEHFVIIECSGAFHSCHVVLAEITHINQYASQDFFKVSICQRKKKRGRWEKTHVNCSGAVRLNDDDDDDDDDDDNFIEEAC